MLPNLRTEAGTELGLQKDSLGERKLESVDKVVLKKKKKKRNLLCNNPGLVLLVCINYQVNIKFLPFLAIDSLTGVD